MPAPLSAERLSQLEVAAMQAVAALKDAKKIRSKKADWRLVAAAQAMHRGELLDEFEAAAAMGKTIAQRREVSNWMERLKELETCAVTSTSEVTRLRSGLLVNPGWLEGHASGVKQLNVGSLVLSPKKQHAKRALSAISTTPTGTSQQVNATVDYTLPPADERESASKRRADKHWQREARSLRSMDLSGAAEEHAAAEASRLRKSREDEREVATALEACIEQVCLTLTPTLTLTLTLTQPHPHPM
jgi:hypothetical protein